LKLAVCQVIYFTASNVIICCKADKYAKNGKEVSVLALPFLF